MTSLTVLLLLVARAPAVAPAEPAQVHRWPDGLTLVVQPVPGARSSSLRTVIRAGGFLDPVGKAGLAHVVEHALLAGARGQELIRDVRSARGELNAFTGGGRTLFTLDAPADRFAGLAERYLRVVTSPDFGIMNVPKELAVVDQEESFRGASAEVPFLDSALFPAPSQQGSIIGTDLSRGECRVEDIRGFFLDHYVPPLTTIVLTGAVTLEGGIRLVERAYLVPPVPAPAARPPDHLNLAFDQHVPSWITLVAQGYVIDPADREVCRSLAALLELRLVLAVRENGPRVSEVGTTCSRLRGYDLLVAVAYTSTLDAPELPQQVDAVFQSLRRTPPSADERARVDRRLARQRERARSDPAALADALALHVGEVGADRIEDTFPRGLPAPQRIRQASDRSLVRERRFQVEFAPRD